MFSRKSTKRIADLEWELDRAKLYIAKLERDLKQAESWHEYNEELVKHRDGVVLKLTADLRQMDQLIFEMSQCPDWSSMRSIFNNLLELTNLRMRDESNRIRAAIVPEIVKTYASAPTGSHDSTKLLPKARP